MKKLIFLKIVISLIILSITASAQSSDSYMSLPFSLPQSKLELFSQQQWYGIDDTTVKRINPPRVKKGEYKSEENVKYIFYGINQIPIGTIEKAKVVCNLVTEETQACIYSLGVQELKIIKEKKKMDDAIDTYSYEVKIIQDNNELDLGRIGLSDNDIEVYDFNKDQKLDLIFIERVHSCGAGYLRLFLSNKDGSLKEIVKTMQVCC